MELDLTHTVPEGSWLAGYPLIELGVPLWDIVTVVGPKGQRFHWELAADRAELLRPAAPGGGIGGSPAAPGGGNGANTPVGA